MFLEAKIPYRAFNHPFTYDLAPWASVIEFAVSDSQAPQRGGDETLKETCS
jgi:hypothetical protein